MNKIARRSFIPIKLTTIQACPASYASHILRLSVEPAFLSKCPAVSCCRARRLSCSLAASCTQSDVCLVVRCAQSNVWFVTYSRKVLFARVSPIPQVHEGKEGLTSYLLISAISSCMTLSTVVSAFWPCSRVEIADTRRLSKRGGCGCAGLGSAVVELVRRFMAS